MLPPKRILLNELSRIEFLLRLYIYEQYTAPMFGGRKKVT